jgi:hypothetical protein
MKKVLLRRNALRFRHFYRQSRAPAARFMVVEARILGV